MFNERTKTNILPVAPASRELSAGIETASGLWVPEGTAVEMPYVAGPDADTGRGVVVHRFRFHDQRTGTEPDMSTYRLIPTQRRRRSRIWRRRRSRAS